MKNIIIFAGLFLSSLSFAQLESWNDSKVKKDFLEFVTSVTDSNSKDFRKPEERVAVFDFDGTVFVEYPMYSQVRYCYERLSALSKTRSDVKSSNIFKNVVVKSEKFFSALDFEIKKKFWALCLSNQDADTIYPAVDKWTENTVHETLKLKYSALFYAPMKEAITYLQNHGFKVYIVSGSTLDFLRSFVEKYLPIPRENILGSEVLLKQKFLNGQMIVNRLSDYTLQVDHDDKVYKIERVIGRRPIVAFGNSDGDTEMLMYTKFNKDAKGFAALVHHNDSSREFAYDVKSSIGHLEKGLKEAKDRSWNVISMKDDWKRVF